MVPRFFVCAMAKARSASRRVRPLCLSLVRRCISQGFLGGHHVIPDRVLNQVGCALESQNLHDPIFVIRYSPF